MEIRSTPSEARNLRFLWWNFTLREAMLLAFCATFIILTRAALRLHLGLPGHSLFFQAFFLLMARACVPRVGAPTLVGLISGLVGLLLGLSKAGPLVVVNFVLPAVIVDVACAVHPRTGVSYVACALVGVAMSASKSVSGIALDYLMGMRAEVLVGHVLLTTASGAAFGAIGASLVPPVVRRLRANRLIPG
jgi:hypothetical protein